MDLLQQIRGLKIKIRDVHTDDSIKRLADELLADLKPGRTTFGNKAEQAAYDQRCQQIVAKAEHDRQEQSRVEEEAWAEARRVEADKMQIDSVKLEDGDEGTALEDDFDEAPGRDYLFMGTNDDTGEPAYMHVYHYLGLGWQKRIDALYDQVPMEIPAHMIDTPHPWQLKDAQQAHFACESEFRAFRCGDAMGLGKTLLGVLAMWLVKDEPGMSLVVAPKAVCGQWVETFNNAFETGHEMRALWLRDSRMSARELYAQGLDVIVVTYEFLEANMRGKRDLQQSVAEYVKRGKPPIPVRPTTALHSDFWKEYALPFKRLVLDEGHRASRPHTARHQAAVAIYRKATIILSGTLSHNKWHDFAGYFAFVKSHPLLSEGDFRKLIYETDYDGRVYLDNERMRMLQRFLQPFLIARPSSLIELKELTRKQVSFKLMPEEEENVSEYMADYAKHLAMKQNQQGKHAAFGLLVKAQLASLHPLFATALAALHDRDPEDDEEDDDNGSGYFDEAAERVQSRIPREEWLKMVEDCQTLRESSGRLDVLLRLYDWLRKKHPEKKIVIFSQYLRFQDIVARAFKKYNGIDAFRFDGTVTERHRRRVRQMYRECGPQTPLLMTCGAGSVGLNITEASIVIQLEPWWNGNNENQAIARVYRQGQTAEVIALLLVAQNSGIDHTIINTRDKKTRQIEELMEPLVRDIDEGPADIKLMKIPMSLYDFPQPPPAPNETPSDCPS
ncbi:hypothetical protein LTR08_000529 [Meristemomyces frigidus]|nr:hypothetical protein LTR08_000529 [Meristemomyces frigidus]